MAEESFRQATSQTAAWQKRPSERHLQRQQLGRRDLQHSSFKASSLEKALCLSTFEESSFQQSSFEEKRHFALAPSKRTAWKTAASKTAAWKTAASKTAASKTAAWKTAASQTTAWQLSLEQPSFQTRTSRTELVQLQRRTLTTELSEPERTALHTELAELERPALTTELAQLQTSRFEESSFDSLDSPAAEKAASTAQLCFTEASFSFLLGGPSLETSSRRGGVLKEACLTQLDLELDLLDATLWLKLRQLTQEKGACSPCSLSLSGYFHFARLFLETLRKYSSKHA